MWFHEGNVSNPISCLLENNEDFRRIYTLEHERPTLRVAWNPYFSRTTCEVGKSEYLNYSSSLKTYKSSFVKNSDQVNSKSYEPLPSIQNLKTFPGGLIAVSQPTNNQEEGHHKSVRSFRQNLSLPDNYIHPSSKRGTTIIMYLVR